MYFKGSCALRHSVVTENLGKATSRRGGPDAQTWTETLDTMPCHSLESGSDGHPYWVDYVLLPFHLTIAEHYHVSIFLDLQYKNKCKICIGILNTC